MNRRNFLAAAGVASFAPILPKQPAVIREVMFNSPSEPSAIYWMKGHVSDELFMLMNSEINDERGPLTDDQIRRGWATRKLESIVIYLSDAPQENFEPITYWIPRDYSRMELTQ